MNNMIKKISIMAAAALLLTSFRGMAQTATNVSTDSQTNISVVDRQVKKDFRGKKDRKDRKDRKHKNQSCEFDKATKAGCQTDLFAGMNLTDTQRSQLARLRQNRQAADSAARAQARQERQTARADRQNRDSLNMVKRTQAKREYLNSVRSIVGPENYVIYLENIVLQSPGHDKGANFRKANFRNDDNRANFRKTSR
ncbi:MAG: hypothetical protein SO006_01750 [Muribaculaceae bacterium]|nr:hypothetical protein [Muribaculaceae bacterium]